MFVGFLLVLRCNYLKLTVFIQEMRLEQLVLRMHKGHRKPNLVYHMSYFCT